MDLSKPLSDKFKTTVTVKATANATEYSETEDICKDFFFTSAPISGADLNVTLYISADKIHVKIEGPSDKWFAMALGESMNDADAWIMKANAGEEDGGTFYEYHLKGFGVSNVVKDAQNELEHRRVTEEDGRVTMDFWRARIPADDINKPVMCENSQDMLY